MHFSSLHGTSLHCIALHYILPYTVMKSFSGSLPISKKLELAAFLATELHLAIADGLTVRTLMVRALTNAIYGYYDSSTISVRQPLYLPSIIPFYSVEYSWFVPSTGLFGRSASFVCRSWIIIKRAFIPLSCRPSGLCSKSSARPCSAWRRCIHCTSACRRDLIYVEFSGLYDSKHFKVA